MPNQAGAEDAAMTVLFHSGRKWHGTPDPQRSAYGCIRYEF
jgi:hypothetical protein